VQGKPDGSGEPVVTTRVLSTCTRGCGCIGRPAFAAPSVLGGTKFMHSPGASRRGIERAYVFGSLKIESMFETPRPPPVKTVGVMGGGRTPH
jgi:hypothetical protein